MESLMNKLSLYIGLDGGKKKSSAKNKIAERRQNFADSQMSGNEEKLRSPKVWCFISSPLLPSINNNGALMKLARALFLCAVISDWSRRKMGNQFAYLWKFTWFTLFIFELLGRVNSWWRRKCSMVGWLIVDKVSRIVVMINHDTVGWTMSPRKLFFN